MAENIREIALKACDIIDDRMGTDIVCLDITKMTIISDYFVIASGRNPNHVKSIYDELEVKMEEMGYPLVRAEGYSEGRWCVLDFGDVMVHVFHEQDREYYQLERLWADGTNEVELDFDKED